MLIKEFLGGFKKGYKKTFEPSPEVLKNKIDFKPRAKRVTRKAKESKPILKIYYGD